MLTNYSTYTRSLERLKSSLSHSCLNLKTRIFSFLLSQCRIIIKIKPIIKPQATRSCIAQGCLIHQEKNSKMRPANSPLTQKYNESIQCVPTCLDSLKRTSSDKDFTSDTYSRLDKDETISHVKPRSYQIEMFEESQKHNIIIAMDTGSGKTHISDNIDRWTEQNVWDSVLKNIDIVVSPYQILLDALTHGFVKFDSLALLVVDEGAKIMSTFYHPRKSLGLYVPHILGLSASPVMGSDPASLVKIENTLDSLSRTPTKTRMDLRQRVKLPTLIPVKYDEELNEYSSNTFLSLENTIEELRIENDPYYISLIQSDDSRSQRKLQKLLLNHKTWCSDHLRSLLNIYRRIYFELGSWAVEFYISRVISKAINLAKESQELSGIWEDNLENLEKKYLAEVLGRVQIGNSNCSTFQGVPRISDKVSKLIEILREQKKGFSGIVFVQERAVVSCLASILTEHPLSCGIVKVGKFVGTSVFSRRTTSTFDLIDIDSQNNALQDFRSGKTNLLIGTSVLEEGIDIPTCNLVLCFQRPANLKSYIQRRGRARQEESRLYLLLNSDKDELGKFEMLEAEMRALYEDETRSLEETPLEAENIDDLKAYNERKFQIEKTDAILDLDNALSHLYHFCATIPSDKYVDTRPEFISHKKKELYHASIILPISVHKKIRTAQSSHAWKSERNAIRDAAFETYVALYKAGLISDNLLPLMRHSPIDDSVVEKRPSLIEVQKQIDPWPNIAKAWHCNPRLIYRSTIKFDGLEFYLYLPVKLPVVNEMKVYWDEDTELIISIDSPSVEVATDPEMLRRLNEETRTLIHSAFPLERHRNDEMVIKFSGNQDLSHKLQLGYQNVPENIGSLQNIGIIRDHQDVGYLFKELLSQKPDAKNVQKANSEFMSAPNDVPYLSLSRISRRRDYTHPVISSSEKKSKALFSTVLPMTKCRLDNIPFKFVRFALMIPSIMRNIELHLIADIISKNQLSNAQISDVSMLKSAICTGSAREATNYQRLEFLGDNVLKLCASIQIMAENPLWHEGQLSKRKDHLVANSRLARAAIDLEIDKFIVTDSFTGLKWHPIYVESVISVEENKKRKISSKVLADVVESLLGVAMLDGGISKVITCLNKFLPELDWKLPVQHRLSIYEEAPPLDFSHQPKLSTGIEMIETLLGYNFKKKSLLIEAITHASDQSGSSSFERLEFLGDAILDYVIVQEMYPYNLSHVKMHELRTAFVNADLLAFLSIELHANREVFNVKLTETSDDSNTQDAVTCHKSSRQIPLYCFMRHNCFAISQTQQNTHERFKHLRDEILYALETGAEYPWTALCGLKAEKFFSDMVEALIAAVWVDSGSFDTVVNLIERIGILKFLRRAISDDVNIEHPKIKLGKLADTETVCYKFHMNTETEEKSVMICTVFIGNIEVACVSGQLSKLELQTRGAVEAIKNFEVFLEAKRQRGDLKDLSQSTDLEGTEAERNDIN